MHLGNAPGVDPRLQSTERSTSGGRGYFGTVQGGCDYQFALGSWNMVVGAFGDYDFANEKGQLNLPSLNQFGQEKLSSKWAVGGRIGWLVTPSLLTYFSGGYTEAKFDRVDINFNLAPATVGFLNGQTYKGSTPSARPTSSRTDLPPWPVLEDRIPLLAVRYQEQPPVQRHDRLVDFHLVRLAEVGTQRSQRVGLPLQLGWPGRRQVLSSARLATEKPRLRPGLFVPEDRRTCRG